MPQRIVLHATGDRREQEKVTDTGIGGVSFFRFLLIKG